MPISAETMRLLIVVCAVGMLLIAALYLRRRQLTTTQYLVWGLLALLVPVLGPFLVIALRPGKVRKVEPWSDKKT
jgi:hypothetical protein